MERSSTPRHLYYTPRETLYEVIAEVKIKSSTSSEWIDGLAYKEAFNDFGQVFVRPLDKFDERWVKY